MDLSIVIPAFNESRKIQKDIKAAEEFLLDTSLTGEIIVVDDGSSDDTADVASSITVDSRVKKQVIRYVKNAGKGFAVKAGMKATSGEYVLMADCGCCVPYAYALKGLDLLKSGQWDVANGSRKRADSVIKKRQRLSRRMLSKIFRKFFIIFMNVPEHFTDTQCGFKMYKGDVARELYAECLLDGFAFDVDILLRAIKKGYRVTEFPVEWTSDADTRLIPLVTSWRVLYEFFKIRKDLARRSE